MEIICIRKIKVLGHALHEKNLQRQNRRRHTGLQPGTKKRFSSRWSNAGQPLILFLRRFLIRIKLYLLPERRSRECSRFAGAQEQGSLLAGLTQRRPVLSSPALPRCPAVRRAEPTRPWCFWVLDSTCILSIFPDMPCMKRIYSVKIRRRRHNGQQPGTKSAFRPAAQTLVNRSFRSSVGF